ncbi:NADP-dependent phosphogluconate dehydrogenase [Herbiconiux sp. L3-i23]|uniref:NADP-dependent phosphogluconate dehydrogenase n=1 Tax=Herbiconiux sp. L3-i23 TaxID=2905871 RepID=UPI0020614BD2|nr:NADP-dependent phosphogluconate dehydrogenase [Herbiconiux sp. L3-i23]BDI22568.1 6-phosphogluconate dehydrogenase [Herbiconiux sp. L3-i23]
MQIGLLGLGKMGGGMALRLAQGGHDVLGVDLSEESRRRAEDNGARTFGDLRSMLAALDGPRIVWVMLPAGRLTREAVTTLAGLLSEGDLVIDGGNSDFRDAPGHVETLSARGIRFADIGVSGGQWGWQNGYGLMVGSDEPTYREIVPILDSLAAEGGYSRVGDVGAGHLVKAIHNGIQYGVLQAYAEGFALLKAHPEVDTVAAMSAWQGGSSIRSWLLEQTVEALKENPTLDGVGSQVSDSGMGRWTAEEAIRLAVPTPVLTAGLHARFASRADDDAAKLLVAARGRIGGQKS